MLEHADFDKVWNLLQEVEDHLPDLTDDEAEAIELIIAACQPSGWSPAAALERERMADEARCTCCSEADCVCDGRTACCAN